MTNHNDRQAIYRFRFIGRFTFTIQLRIELKTILLASHWFGRLATTASGSMNEKWEMNVRRRRMLQIENSNCEILMATMFLCETKHVLQIHEADAYFRVPKIQNRWDKITCTNVHLVIVMRHMRFHLPLLRKNLFWANSGTFVNRNWLVRTITPPLTFDTMHLCPFSWWLRILTANKCLRQQNQCSQEDIGFYCCISCCEEEIVKGC